MIYRNHVDYAFSGAVAHKYGVQAAMVMNRIIWSINIHEERKKEYADKYFVDDVWWMDDSYEALASHFNGLIKVESLRKLIRILEKDGLLLSRKIRATTWDQTKWYAINGAEWDALHGKPAENSMRSNLPHRGGTSDRIEVVPATASSSLNSLTNSQSNLSPEPERELSTDEESIMNKLKWLGPGMSISFVRKMMENYWIDPQKMVVIAEQARSYYEHQGKKIKKPEDCLLNWTIKELDRTRKPNWREIITARRA